MISTSSALLVLSLLAPFSVRAANDWSVPCVGGGCSWDTGDGKTTAYSSIAIGGTNNLISDITPAAGWKISGCNPNWKSGKQTVQMTCTGTSRQTAHCGHLFEGGVEHTIVRLPESCGTGPFARVVSAANKTDSIARRAANSSSVGGTHMITLDYDFHQIPTSRGKVTFAVTSTNLKGVPGVSKRDLDALRGRGRAGELHRKRFARLTERGFSDFLNDAANAASDVGDAIGDAASAVTSAAGSAASSIGSAVSSANTIDKTLNSGKLTPVSFNKDVVLFDKSISCASGDVSGNAEFKIDVDGKVDATVSFGVTIVGTIVPPKLNDFTVTADLSGSTSATFNIDAKAEGKFDTSSVELFKTGFPGLSIPSIVNLGPEFSINAQASVDLKAEAKMAFKAAWDFPNVKLIFPEEKGASTGDATVSNTNNPLQLSADPSADVSATITAHIIPRIDFGIDLFDGVGQASIFIDADVSATLSADVNAKAEANNQNATTTTSATTSATSTASNATQTSTSADNSTTSSTDSTSATDSTTSTSADNSTTSSTSTDSTSATDSTTTTTASTTDTTASSTDTAASTTDSATASAADTATTTTAASTADTATSTTAADSSTDADTAATTTAADSVTNLDTATSTSADVASATDGGAASAASDEKNAATSDASTDSTADPTETTTADDPAETADSSADSTDQSADTSDDTDASSSENDTPPPADDQSAPTDDDSSQDDSADDGGDDGGEFGGDDGGDDGSEFGGDDGGDDSGDFGGDEGGDFGGDEGGDDGGFFKKRSSRGLRRRATSASADGCITLSAGIDINAGLTGSLEPFFDKKEKSFKIFSKDVQLFQKCLNGAPAGGDAATKRRRGIPAYMRRADSSGLQCPTSGIASALQSLI